MDTRKAIATIGHIMEYIVENQDDHEYAEPIDMAIEAIKKQIPLKPIETWDDGFVCPICNGFTTCQKWKNGYPYNAEFEYCPTCGQKLEQEVE